MTARSLAIPLLLALLSTPAARATTFIERPFPDTIRDAPIIVRGKVGMTHADWGRGQDGTKQIYTNYELQIDEVFKGRIETPTITMRELGGERDGVGLQVAGTAQFTRGEDVVVFLTEKNQDGAYDVQGMMMGKYNVEKDENGQEYLAGAGISRGSSEHVLTETKEGHPDPGAPKKWTLDALRQVIRQQAGEPPPKAQPRIQPTFSPVTQKPVLTPKATASSAPQLQPDTDREPPQTEGSSYWMYLLALGVVVGLGVLWTRFR